MFRCTIIEGSSDQPCSRQIKPICKQNLSNSFLINALTQKWVNSFWEPPVLLVSWLQQITANISIPSLPRHLATVADWSLPASEQLLSRCVYWAVTGLGWGGLVDFNSAYLYLFMSTYKERRHSRVICWRGLRAPDRNDSCWAVVYIELSLGWFGEA